MSNHIYLLVYNHKEDVIPKPMQLIAGRTARGYNIRKNRTGAFWEDRYHATAVDTNGHLIRCLVYIDLNIAKKEDVPNISTLSYSSSKSCFFARALPRNTDLLMAVAETSNLRASSDMLM
jgi:hypothetical protein